MGRPPSRVRRITDASPKSLLADRFSGGVFGGLAQLESVAKRSTARRGAGSPVGGRGDMVSVSDQVSPAPSHTQTPIPDLQGVPIGGPRRMAIYRVAGSGFDPGVAALFVGGQLLAQHEVASGGLVGITVPWFVGGGAPWDPLPLILADHPTSGGSATLTVSIFYES